MHSDTTVRPDAPVHDPDEAHTNGLNPLVPRPIDRPTELPLPGDGREMLDPAVGDIAKIFSAPSDPADWPAWREALAAWRDDARARLAYTGEAYDRPDQRWTSSCYSVALVWLWDERLFDRATSRFTVEAFLERTADHGGFDGVVLWHAYPVIGIDERNQFDFYRDVPGMADVVRAFQRRGIRVFINYNPWDTGTRRPDGDDPTELAALVGELGVDGVFLDTLKQADDSLVTALRFATPPQVLEGESRVPNERIADHQLSWAQWFADSDAPGVMRAHLFEQRHMMHSTRRWNRDHSAELQSAWMNGTGMLVWDTVFGVWVGWNERDKATLRSMLRVQRALTDVFSHGDWQPLAGGTEAAIAAGVYTSTYRLGSTTLFMLVNRGDSDYRGEAVAALVGGLPSDGSRAYDLCAGVELDDAQVSVPARGVTAVLVTMDAAAPTSGDRVDASASASASTSFELGQAELSALLAEAADDRARSAEVRDSMADWSAFPARTARRTLPERSRFTGAGSHVGVVPVAAGDYALPFRYRRRETGTYQGAPYVEEWKPLAPRLHDDRDEIIEVTLGSASVAAREVTVAEFTRFVAETGYQPGSSNRFLIGTASGSGHPDVAVTGVSLDDARAYAAWAGARLPTEFEWQVAAEQPGFERIRPLVWNWTESEHTDGITRFSMLKGGSDYEAPGSDWYVDGGEREPAFSLKFLATGLGIDRSPHIGFRLAWDTADADDEGGTR
ncbi:SUMF1/EgtB/PvdO family nonheme iron enzyme [Okibacterium fritillariae]|uniref:Sulfatase-modifying factor enzyme 1 n=1 Tax=Okibacterium fritillariae TaxID=123320 RepID=A0A1T5JRY4_9MICO|nr:SUMF1/EgtB/PvdO family nonheme iron enzyme [Okibacterium fritillariae]SKC54039.1 Sulfatase-modifying factor enzyme 1 [Okibacterium fritillariae]